MREKIILDTGPIVALFDRNDNFHRQIYKFFETWSYKFYITWPVITEVTFLLDFHKETQMDFIKWLEKGALDIVPLDVNDLPVIRKFMDKYSNVPMDLADGSLMLISEKLNINKIITLDSDFYIYRKLNGNFLENIIPDIKKK